MNKNAVKGRKNDLSSSNFAGASAHANRGRAPYPSRSSTRVEPRVELTAPISKSCNSKITCPRLANKNSRDSEKNVRTETNHLLGRREKEELVEKARENRWRRRPHARTEEDPVAAAMADDGCPAQVIRKEPIEIGGV